MRQILLSFLLLFVFPVMIVSQEERLYTHHSDIVIDTLGVIKVREKIRIYAKGDLFKRGITRELPITRYDVKGKPVKVNYNILDVYKNGNKEEFFVTKSETGHLLIYIGDKNRLLEPGYYDYEIVYESIGQIGFYDTYDELAWNVNGAINEPVDVVSCEIRLPQGADILSYRCYTGAYGSTEGDCNSESSIDGVFKASSSNLKSNEMMTVYVGFEKGIVHDPVIKETFIAKLVSLLDILGLWFANLIIIPLLLLYYIFIWRKHGIDPPKPIVVPQFTPPNNMSPANMAMIYEEHYDSSFVTTSIINLAIKGYLRIEEIERKGILKFGGNHYKLFKLKDEDSSLPSEEGTLLKHLFVVSNEITLDGSYDSNVANMINKFQKDMNKQNKEILSEGRNSKLKIVPWLVLIGYIALLFFYGRNEPMELYVTLAVMMIPVFFVVSFIQVIYAAIKKRKPRRLLSISISIAVIVGVLGALIYFPINRLSSTAIALLVGLPIVLIGHNVFSYLIRRPSEKLLQLQSDIEGLKMYIGLAEEKQIQYFNPPEVTPEVFEELLPYAIALKVDKVWGEKFENRLLKSMQTNDSYVPLWYVGSSMRPANFSSSLQQSLSSNIRQGSISPGSSGGDWSSGSFGGGSVGGGGGGGRTGGW